DQGLDVVRVGVLPDERVVEPGRRLDLAELAGQVEGVAVWRLHLDPVALAGARLEAQARHDEPLRPPPTRQLPGIGEGREHLLARSRKNALRLEDQARPRSCGR